jgi:PAS domain S-box-containing protein
LTTLSYPGLLDLLSFVLSLCIGVAVLLRNPSKTTHRAFFVMTINMALWALGVVFIVESHEEGVARVGIMAAFVLASFLPVTFYRFIAYFPRGRFEGSRAALYFFYAAAVVFSLGVFTPWHLTAVHVFPDAPPTPEHGPLLKAYSLLVLLSSSFAFVNLIRKLWTATGIERRQVQHVMLGIFASSFLAIATNVLAPLMNISSLEPYGPSFNIFMIAIFAYAMVRYHLLDIWLIFSRTTLYAFVTGFIVFVFWASVSMVHWAVTGWGVADLSGASTLVSTLIAALIVAVILQPIKEGAQLFLDRMLVKKHFDANALLARLSQCASEIVYLDELLLTVAQDIEQTVGVTSVRVLLIEKDRNACLRTVYSTVRDELDQVSCNLGPLIEHVHRHTEPLVQELLVHEGPDDSEERVIEQLRLLDAQLCIPLKTKGGLLGLMTLGAKVSGDIYTAVDVLMFQALAGPLATAIDNASLYTKLEEANLHRELVLSVMKGGVIAVDNSGRVNTVNASTISTLGPIRMGQHLTTLPKEIAKLLGRILTDKAHISDFETVIESPDGGPVHVAMSASRLTTADGEVKGAMAMIYDLTQIKRLEQHVARADQLSSIGTLAAGMAHEIKNPLVSIKTMTQLLLSKYDDADFRSTFSDIVPHEVERIDSIVSGLLDFARPKPTKYGQHDVRNIVEKVITLLDSQILKNNITLIAEFPDEPMSIYGDEQQLHQVFLNLALNAIDAMKGVATRVLRVRGAIETTHLSARDYLTVPDVECVKISFADTGCGIANDSIKNLFTPFFTTKPHGSGLGLSVAHGIIKEHGGMIDVRSRPGEGAVFEVTLPIVGTAHALRET